MKASKYIVLLYGAMIGVPLLLFVNFLVFALDASNFTAIVILEALIVIGLVVYGIMGIIEAYGYSFPKASSLGKMMRHRTEKLATKMEKGGEKIEINLKRFNPERKALDQKSYEVEANRFTTVLDALISVKQNHDNSLAVRYSCRMGVCGSCGVVVNGKPSLACETCLTDVAKDGKVEVEPMQAHPLLKDLVTDFDDFFEKHMKVEPGLYRKNVVEQNKAVIAYKQSTDERNKYLPYSSCIMCGLCLDACPVVNSNPKFIGPQALSQAYRYHEDSRDQKGSKRLNLIDSLEDVWGCEFAGSCSEVCPKGVDPAGAIQALKFEIFGENLKLGKEKKE
jgi:succinate dehydrogenase / fumarate reductase iron-sulfur subunit